jgi:hypothetical protein
VLTLGKIMGRYNTIEDFWTKVNKTTSTGCWEWTAGKVKDGYGSFKMNKQWRQTHRWVMMFEGHDIKDKVVMHKCDNPSCVNPDHLTLGTQADNVQDMHAKGRYVKPLSKLSDLDIIDIRTSNLSLSKISKKYNISIPYASNIRNYKGSR